MCLQQRSLSKKPASVSGDPPFRQRTPVGEVSVGLRPLACLDTMAHLAGLGEAQPPSAHSFGMIHSSYSSVRAATTFVFRGITPRFPSARPRSFTRQEPTAIRTSRNACPMLIPSRLHSGLVAGATREQCSTSGSLPAGTLVQGFIFAGFQPRERPLEAHPVTLQHDALRPGPPCCQQLLPA